MKTPRHLSILIFPLLMAALPAQAIPSDRVSGTAKADFINHELTIPCVLVESLNGAAEDLYFDVTLKRRGFSLNYQLATATPEDAELCAHIAAYAEYHDDDYDTGEGDPDMPDILATCAAGNSRSSVTVEAKDLEAGNYFTRLISGSNTLDSMLHTSVDGEVAFSFDSDADAVANGAEALDSGFISEQQVLAEIWDENGESPVVSSTVDCTELSDEEPASDTENE